MSKTDEITYQILAEFISNKIKHKFRKNSEHAPRVGEYELRIIENIYEGRKPCENIPPLVCNYLLDRLKTLGVISEDGKLTELGDEIIELIKKYKSLVEKEVDSDTLFNLLRSRQLPPLSSPNRTARGTAEDEKS